MTTTNHRGGQWHVSRTGAPRAVATCDCGGTVAQLAAKIHLDPVEYRKWLMAGDGEALPATEHTPIDPGGAFTIPNRVCVNDLLPWHWFQLWHLWRRVEIRGLKRAGCEVIYVADTPFDLFGQQMGDANVQGIVVLSDGDPQRKGDYSDVQGYHTAPATISPHHKLAGLKAIWCWSGVKRDDWQALVAPTGYLFAHPGKVHFWKAWPGNVQNGLPRHRIYKNEVKKCRRRRGFGFW